MRICPRRPLMTALLLNACGAAQAHDIWMTTSGSGADTTAHIFYGDLVKPDFADKSRIVSLDLLENAKRHDLRDDLAKDVDHGRPMWVTKRFDAPRDGVIAAVYDNGFWMKQPGDTRETNATILMLPGVTAEHWWTTKSGKRLLGAGAFRHKTGSRLELVPLADPFAVPVGKTVRVRLELEGKPVPGAKIAYTDGIAPIPDDRQPTALTDADGVALVPIARKGAYLLTTDVNAPARHPALAERDHLYTSLSFDTND